MVIANMENQTGYWHWDIFNPITRPGHGDKLPGKGKKMKNSDEISLERQKEIKGIMAKGYDQSLEQALYCDYDYVDCFNRCANCNLVNYNRDCHNNPID